jgi:putative ABC transport system substrate-binding protein
LARLTPDIIVGGSQPVAVALRRNTRTIPIVFVNADDPVGGGLVESLAHPGGNMTGFTNVEPSMGGKWLELLKEIEPGTKRVGLLFNPETTPYGVYAPSDAAATSLAVKLIAVAVRDPGEIGEAIGALGREPGSGMIVLPGPFISAQRGLVIRSAAKSRLPTVYPYRFHAAEGGLISYGIDLIDTFQRAASYVDRILRGTNPADLPVQQPVKFELLINLKAAKALGLTVSPSLLARADEVIE